MSKIETYFSYWNGFVKDWQSKPLVKFDQDLFSHAYRAKNGSTLKPEYLPEPFLGNPSRNSAVIINKNPGSELQDLQHYRTGSFITRNHAHLNYTSFAIEFPYLNEYNTSPGGQWWDLRKSWIARLLAHRRTSTNSLPFALELCHWHSNQFHSGLLKINKDFLTHVNDKIISPAETANLNSDLGVILSCGSIFTKIFDRLGFENLQVINKHGYPNEIKFPEVNGKPASGEFSVWRSPGKHLYLNFTHGSQFNLVPEDYWKNVETYLVQVALFRSTNQRAQNLPEETLNEQTSSPDQATNALITTRDAKEHEINFNLAFIIVVAAITRKMLCDQKLDHIIEVVRVGENGGGERCAVWLRPRGFGVNEPTTSVVNGREHFQNDDTLLTSAQRIIDVRRLQEKIDTQVDEMNKRGLIP